VWLMGRVALSLIWLCVAEGVPLTAGVNDPSMRWM